jgi:hypothetical protein
VKLHLQPLGLGLLACRVTENRYVVIADGAVEEVNLAGLGERSRIEGGFRLPRVYRARFDNGVSRVANEGWSDGLYLLHPWCAPGNGPFAPGILLFPAFAGRTRNSGV